MKHLQPADWPRPKGYANGVLAAGEMIFVAGQVGWDKTETVVSESFVDQARQAFQNIVDILGEAGAGAKHIVRMTWFVTNKEEYLSVQSELGAAYRDVIGLNFPAMSVVEVKGLIEVGAKLEIEATAIIPAS